MAWGSAQEIKVEKKYVYLSQKMDFWLMTVSPLSPAVALSWGEVLGSLMKFNVCIFVPL